jgi:hypothetical protein
VKNARLALPGGWQAWACLAFALLLLNASLTFANVWPTAKIRWQNALSIELAVGVLLMATRRPARTSRLSPAIPAIWLLLVLGHYLDVTAPGLYGRDFNLYWDAPHLGNVFAMLAEAAPTWLLVAAAVGVFIGIVTAYAISRVAWLWIADAMARRQLRRALAASAATVLAVFLFQQLTRGDTRPLFAEPVTAEYLYQARSIAAMVGPGAVAPQLDASPDALMQVPNGLGGADVLLIFVESYGAVAFDSPALTTALTASRAAFEAAVHDTGRQLVSAYVESPTFGGSSWLAHLSLMSGIAVRDPYSYQALMAEQRPTLSTTFSRAGYRSIALMPGMRQAWPEGAFYHYDAIYGRDDLTYIGPRFGWWSIPDQYSLAKLDALTGAATARAPLFVVFPTSTTHAPFGPVAPYQPDWSKVLTPDAYDPAEVQRILARPPDLANLAADYAHAMSYEFTTFAGYVRRRAADKFVMILIGDHQPPAVVSGRNAPWTVPVHIVTQDPRIIDRLLSHGFRPGLTPSRPSIGEMHELVPMMIAAFSARTE